MGAQELDDELLQEIAYDVEREFGMGGLSSGTYFDYASEVAKRFYMEKIKGKGKLE